VLISGAAQMICYVADSIWRQNKVRESTAIVFNTAKDKLFPVERYEEELQKVVAGKSILVNTLHSLHEVDAANKTAIFDVLDKNGNPTGKRDEFQVRILLK
jgi:hypothetical protein